MNHDHFPRRADDEPLPHVVKHTHIGVPESGTMLSAPKVVLAGNPNVGKSLFFNHLSGMYVEVSNYPGTTVEITKGKYKQYEVYDTPGIYGVSSFTEDENVARDIILNADVVLNVADAVHLERDLFLTQQLIDMGKRVALFLNFSDELERQGIEIDVKLLSSYLGIPVFVTSAVTKKGFEFIDEAIERATVGSRDRQLHSQLHEGLSVTGSEAEALLVLEGDDVIAERHGVPPGIDRERLYIERRNKVNLIVSAVLSEKGARKRFSNWLGRMAISPWMGLPILALVLYGIYLFVGVLVAGDLVNFLETRLGNEWWEPMMRSVVAQYIPAESAIGTILVGEFGVLTMTVTYLLFLLLPLVIAFYLSLAILEDSGYLPRLATLADRSLNAVGLNGNAVIPLILGFGCVTMATITTRILGSEREKTIATTILQFAIPCSAQLAVITALLIGAGLVPTIIYSITMLIVFVGIGTILHRTLPGKTSPLLIDLPPMRFPRFDNIARKTMFRTYNFMKEATPWFFIGAFTVGILQVTGGLTFWQDVLAPLTTDWLQLPREAATAFVMGLVRRDFGAAGLYQMALSPAQITVALVTITLFVPCIASLMVMIKERGLKQAFFVWTGTWVAAFTVGGILSQILM